MSAITTSSGTASRHWIGSAWWARGKEEEARGQSARCSRDGCANPVDAPFDLFCKPTGHGDGAAHLLVLAGETRQQTIVIYALRGLLGLLVLIAASSRSPIALYVVACLAGLMVLVLPLRHFPVARVVAPLLWICALGWAVAAHEDWIGSAVGEGMEIGVVSLVAFAWVSAVALSRSPEQTYDLSQRGIATGLAVAVVTGVLWVAFALGFANITLSLSRVFLLIFVSLLGAVLGAGLIAGLVQGAQDVCHERKFRRRALPPAPQIRRPRLPRPQASHGFTERLGFSIRWTAARIAAPIVEAANSTIRAMHRTADLVAEVLARALYLMIFGTEWTSKLLLATMLVAFAKVRTAAAVVVEASRRWAQTTVLSLVVLALSAEGAVISCSLFSSYIGGATLLDGLGAIALAILSACILVAIWWSLTKWAATEIAKSASHSAEMAGPTLFLVLVALGWIDGAIGLLGYGPLRPGYLTIAGTIILAAILVVAYRNKEGQASAPAPAGRVSPPSA